MTQNFFSFFERAFKMIQTGIYFFVITLHCQVIQDFDLCKLDVTRLKQNYVKSQKMEHLCKCWCAIRTTYCDRSFDVTIATYLLPDLYIPKMKNALFVGPGSNSLSCAYAVLCPYLLIPTEWTSRGNNISWRRKLWFYRMDGEGLESIVLPWKCHSGHIMDLCDEYNNCTKFQLCTEKVFREMPFFVSFHRFCVNFAMSQVF